MKISIFKGLECGRNGAKSIPHSSSLISHFSFLISHFSFLISHSSFLIPHFSFLISLILLAGCYGDRWTGNYSDAMGNFDDSAVLEESGQDEDSENARMEILQKLADEESQAYRINAGDKIDVRVYGHDDLSVTTKVSPDGSIGMVFIGQVEVAGRTISEARDAIESGLAPYVRHPVVGVTVLEVSSETITISGAAARPGLYSITSSSRLADAYAMAGGSAQRLFNGVDVDVADLEHSVVVRDGIVLPVDFQAAINGGDRLNNVKLRKGDYIFIAQRMESSITICGEVKNPHRRLYEPGMGIIEALSASGWMFESHWSHVIIIRDSLSDPKLYKVDVDGILAGKRKNIRLKPNDIIYVPKDNLAEYNVFVRKLLPTAQLFSLLTSRISSVSSN